MRMRISAEQKQALMAAAERDGLELSAWLRQVALRAAGLLPRKVEPGELLEPDETRRRTSRHPT